jgi:general secretion pathway protein G
MEELDMNRRASIRHARRGFSLIELLIAIAILLAIGGLVVVNLLPAKEGADVDLTKAQIDQFANAIKFFKIDMKRIPTEEEGLAVLWSKDALENEEDEANWKRAYLEEPMPRDTWGNEWIYRAPSEVSESLEYDIISMGPDGEEDTDDDITNHFRRTDAEGELSDEFEEFGGSEPVGAGDGV